MAIPTKGSRTITVDGEAYRWLVRRKATYLQSDYGDGKIHVAIEHAEINGATLHVKTQRAHPKDWATNSVTPVTPIDISGWIRIALDSGWRSKRPGPTFTLDET